MTERLIGKVAIITGAARGMGAAHARQFVAEGACVVATDIRTDEGAALAADLGTSAMFVTHDVTNREQWEMVVAKAEQRFGPITTLVNNAGVGFYETLESTSWETYQRCIDLNQNSVFRGMKSALPSLRRAGGGSIVNISSAMGLKGAPGVFPYAVAKFAVRGLSRAAAVELASENIRVNTVFPGSIRTPAFNDFTQQAGDAADKIIAGTIPLARIADIDEVTGMVVFLASDESRYCTGGEYAVDGGLTA